MTKSTTRRPAKKAAEAKAPVPMDPTAREAAVRRQHNEPDLLHIAATKSQAHLLALSTRKMISEAVAEILVSRGDRDVARSVATNRQARLSENAFTTLVQRSEQDNIRRKSACAPTFRRGCSGNC